MILWAIGTAVGIWALKKAIPDTCDHATTKVRWSEFSGLIKQLTDQVQRSNAAGKLTAVLQSRVNALAVRVSEAEGYMNQVNATVAQTLGVSSVACKAIEVMDSVQNEASDLSAEVGGTIGEGSVVPKRDSGWSTASTLLTAGVVAGGLYLGYRWYRHGDTIPRQKLPRYAGGTRRSA